MTSSEGDRGNKFVQGAGISFIGQVFGTGFKYFTQAALAWIYGTEVFGLYTLGLVIYQFGDLIARMGLELGAVRYVSIHAGSNDYRKLKGILLSALGLPLVVGCILGVALFTSSNVIATNIFDKPDLAIVLRAFAFAIPIGASMTAGAFATTGFQVTQYRVFVMDLIVPFMNLCIAILLGLLGFEILGASLAWVVAVMIGLCLTLYFIGKLFPKIVDRKTKPTFQTKELINFSLPLSFGTFLWLLLIWTDVLMLGYFNSAQEVGIYRAASQTAFLMILFDRSLITIFAPTIANLYSQEQFKEASQLFKTSSRWNFALTFPLFIVLAVASKNFLMIFGPDFPGGWITLIILAAGQLTRAGGGGLSMHMLAMSGHQYLKLYGDIVLAITNISLNFMLIPQWGPLGAAIATGISMAGVNLVRVLQVKYVLHVHPYSRNYFNILLCGILAGVVGWFVQSLLQDIFYLFSIVITSFAAIATYFSMLIFIAIEENDRILLSKYMTKIQAFLK